jgi:putative salt-induced outer membrane protein YdiY
MDGTVTSYPRVFLGLLVAFGAVSTAVVPVRGQDDLRMLPPPAPEEAAPPVAPPGEVTIVESTGDAMPLAPSWYNPWSWIGPKIWEGGFEIGINGTSGNSQTFSLRTGANLKRETDRTSSTLDLTYARTEAGSVQTQHNALLQWRIDWKLGESPWAVYKRLGLEYDEFRPFDIRVQLSTGLAYDLLDSETTQLTGRFGGGTSREVGAVDDDWMPEANFGIDFSRKMTDRQQLTATIDYFPVWDDFSDYRIVSNAGWEILLDEASNLKLKILVIDRYDNTPQGAKPNDIDYSLLLLWTL